MKVAVTGGLGFIGSKIVQRLLAAGHEILVLEHFEAKLPTENVPFEIARCDITDMESLNRIKVKGFDALLHLAAQSSGPKSFRIPEIDVKINISGTVNIINWCIENSIEKILFASSFVVYGTVGKRELLTEGDLCSPDSVYAVSKRACEDMLRVLAGPKGLKWNSLRMFNVYGPGQDLNNPDHGMVSIFLNMIRNSNYIGVKGSLSRFRDFVYVDDVVDAWEKCLNAKGCENRIYNVGSGTKTTVGELIDKLGKLYGKPDLKVEEIEKTPGDMLGAIANLSNISRDLGFQPRHNLTEGLSEMVAWAKTLGKGI